jgi:hypothetical protein
MKKNQLDTSDIVSELKSGSVFFQKENIKNPPVPPVREDPDVRSVRPVRISKKREIIRHPFNIYRDQLNTLIELKSTHMMETGEVMGMAEMVREALDIYIQSKQNRT